LSQSTCISNCATFSWSMRFWRRVL
jgi:hypothetical protein